MRRHLTYANVMATLAVFLSMSGGALAAKHYLINSTGQINPKVLKKLKGANGRAGPTGPRGVATKGAKGATGSQGKQGPAGAAGTNGSLAGYSATQTSIADLGSTGGRAVAIPGLSKSLPAGSFIVSASVTVDASSSAPSEGGVVCRLFDTELAPGQETSGTWLGPVDSSSGSGFGAIDVVPLYLSVASSRPSSLEVACAAFVVGSGLTIDAQQGTLVAVQTTSNS